MGEREPQRLSFTSGGERCAAWLYLPEGEGPHPLVVMAHGFAGTYAARLWAYAERFCEAGFAAFVFDYRHFGESEGEPRQLLSVRRQHEDWRAAINYARTLESVDYERVAIWGTSFGGGHVVEIAAGDPRISAVISQSPFADGLGALRLAGPAGAVRLTLAGLRDLGGSLLGRDPYRIPVVGPPGKTGAMTQPASYDGYMRMFGDEAEFSNEVCARFALWIGTYIPYRAAPRVECPLLVLVCSDDDVVTTQAARRGAERAPQGELIEYDGFNHFDIYVGELFERTIVDQIEFLQRTLGVPATAATASVPVPSSDASV